MFDITETRDEILYVVALRPHEGYEEKFDLWYDQIHIPELLACPGFLAARRYRMVRQDLPGAPEYLAVYRVEGMWAFDTPEYLALRARTSEDLDPLSREVVEHRDGLLNAKYTEVFRAEADQG